MKPSRHIIATVAIVLSLLTVTSQAQFSGDAAPNGIHGAALPKPPSGDKVAIVVFEDLGCPACAHAHAIELDAAIKAHVPLLRYDFPIPSHIWTFQGAVCARYIQSKISPAMAEEYRKDVFASQRSISSKDDLQRFTQAWLQRRHQQMPFVMDPDGSLAKAVTADFDLGRRVNVEFTPTVVVVTNDKYQVICGTRTGSDDPARIFPVVQAAIAASHAPAHVSTRKGDTR
jgi:protein-disulfide isomerase